MLIEPWVWQALRGMDVDKDGGISMAEFVRFYMQRLTNATEVQFEHGCNVLEKVALAAAGDTLYRTRSVVLSKLHQGLDLDGDGAHIST